MFTGLIQDVGRINKVTARDNQAELVISTALKSIEIGESIAVNGACLSVTRCDPGVFYAFASKETLQKTGFDALSSGEFVNLERALRMGDPLDGHIVTGHVDEQVKLKSRISQGSAEQFLISLPKDNRLSSQIASKGSVTLNGVSLTINNVYADSFEVMIIPITLQHTTFAKINPGTEINIETDVLAKYVGRMLSQKNAKNESLNIDVLMRSGFMR